MTDTKPSLLELGYWLSSEEHDPKVLVRNAARAEEVGFRLAGISDHFHPWVPEQGQSPFVWSVLGGIAEATDQLRVGTGVTAPLIRMHPAIVAHAAATAAVMLDGRFFLGVGTGERLNEHITGVHWPRPDVRREMLEEAVSMIRRLWEGEPVEHHGAHYTVEQAQLFTRPERPPPIVVAGSSPRPGHWRRPPYPRRSRLVREPTSCRPCARAAGRRRLAAQARRRARPVRPVGGQPPGRACGDRRRTQDAEPVRHLAASA